MTPHDDTELNAAFDAAKREDLAPSDALLDRIMLDADGVLAGPVVQPVRAKPSFGALILDAIGGWPSLSGLAAATVVGVWIGVAPPDVLSDATASLWGETIELPLLESDLFAGLEG